MLAASTSSQWICLFSGTMLSTEVPGPGGGRACAHIKTFIIPHACFHHLLLHYSSKYQQMQVVFTLSWRYDLPELYQKGVFTLVLQLGGYLSSRLLCQLCICAPLIPSVFFCKPRSSMMVDWVCVDRQTPSLLTDQRGYIFLY